MSSRVSSEGLIQGARLSCNPTAGHIPPIAPHENDLRQSSRESEEARPCQGSNVGALNLPLAVTYNAMNANDLAAFSILHDPRSIALTRQSLQS